MENKLDQLFKDAIKESLEYKLAIDTHDYITNKNIDGWRELEDELDVTYPVKGTEVVFDQHIFKRIKSKYDFSKIVDEDMDIPSFEITPIYSDISSRFDKLFFFYLFTKLESFGNNVVKLVNNVFFKKNIEPNDNVWHSRVNKYQEAKGGDLVELFAMPFGLTAKDINPNIVKIFYDLKNKRNVTAHNLTDDILYYQSDYKQEIRSVLAIMCYIYHINDPKKSVVKYNYWEHYNREDGW